MKHCKNQETRRKKKKIFYADSLKLDKNNNNSSVTFEFGLLWGNSREKLARICGAARTLLKEHRARE